MSMPVDADIRFPYQDPSLSDEQRVEDLLQRMPLEAKTALMFHTATVVGDYKAQDEVTKFPPTVDLLDLGLTHFNAMGTASDGRSFAEWSNGLQRLALERPLGIPVSISTDPRHHFGDNPQTQIFAGAFSQWPETLGLAAINSEALTERFADVARQEYVAAGIRVALHPQVDLATEPRWSRISTTFGEDAELTSRMAAAYIRGFQTQELGVDSVSTMTKHFPGGGPQLDGNDAHFPWGREQVYPGDNFAYHLQPFEAALAAGARQIMPYYGMPVGTQYEEVGFGYNKSIITGILRNELGFDGIVCTDWAIVSDNPALGPDAAARAWGVEGLSRDERLLKVIDAGADQFGGEHCVPALVALVKAGRLSEARIDQSARRLLREKFALGLFDSPFVDPDSASVTVGRSDFVAEGRAAQQASQTLLKNAAVGDSPLLPLDAGRKIYAEGFNADAFDGRGELVTDPADADIAILRKATPYTPSDHEGFAKLFHHGTLEFEPEQRDRLLSICRTVPTILCLYLDRPAILGEIDDAAAAIIANYGIADDALVEVLFGDAEPQGSLPFDLPRSTAAVEKSRTDVPFDTADPTYRFGFGLRYGADR